jgi:hypothetical protein
MSNPTYERLLVERDALKSECIRMMDEIATLKWQDAEVRRLTEALSTAERTIANLRRGPACGKRLDCGGDCHLAHAHDGPCLCSGDMDGKPGTCPA